MYLISIFFCQLSSYVPLPAKKNPVVSAATWVLFSFWLFVLLASVRKSDKEQLSIVLFSFESLPEEPHQGLMGVSCGL